MNSVDEFGTGIVSGKDNFRGRKVCESGAEFVGAVVDSVPERGDGAEPLLGVEFGFPVFLSGLIFKIRQELKSISGGELSWFSLLIANEPEPQHEKERADDEGKAGP